MKATAVFLVFFLMITPKFRAVLDVWLGDGQKWLTAWAPLSYMIVAAAIAAPFAVMFLMASWPKPVEPENPLARYKHEDVIE